MVCVEAEKWYGLLWFGAEVWRGLRCSVVKTRYEMTWCVLMPRFALICGVLECSHGMGCDGLA